MVFAADTRFCSHVMGCTFPVLRGGGTDAVVLIPDRAPRTGLRWPDAKAITGYGVRGSASDCKVGLPAETGDAARVAV